MGKTTLAKLVFPIPLICKKVLKKIIKSATREKYTDWDIDQLQRILRDTLDKEKYLLVIDDVWNEDRTKWLELKALLMGGAKGSRIVVTTRSNNVASIMGRVPPYNLNDLSHEYCLSLFFKCAFREA